MSDSEAQLPDMGGLLAQAQKMSEQLIAQQTQAAETQVEGQAGNGAVIVRMSGTGKFNSVKISPSVVEAGDVEMLEDLILVALGDAAANAAKLVEPPALGGLDLGSLGLDKFLGSDG